MVTGMRKWAHNGKDPGDDRPPALYYYDWNRTTRTFERHVIDEGGSAQAFRFVQPISTATAGSISRSRARAARTSCSTKTIIEADC